MRIDFRRSGIMLPWLAVISLQLAGCSRETPRQQLERERRLTLAAGIPLSFKDANAKRQPPPDPKADRAYGKLIEAIGKDSPRSAGTSYYTWVQGPEKERARSLAEARLAAKGGERVVKLAHKAAGFMAWPWHEGQKIELEQLLKLVALSEQLVLKASISALDGDFGEAARLLETGRAIGAHLIARGATLDILNGDLILRIIADAVLFIVEKLKPSRAFLEAGLRLSERPQGAPAPPDWMELELAEAYEWRFRDPNMRLRAHEGYDSVKAEITWLRATRELYSELRGKNPSIQDVVNAIQRHGEDVDAQLPQGSDGYRMNAWKIKTISTSLADEDEKQKLLKKRIERMLERS